NSMVDNTLAPTALRTPTLLIASPS
ncbi:MAG: hypothetical protein K0R33_4759, partial [Mycobacterium sp.]|nr:hypothetical protein [Mycobacterium sp.]